jgi:hypothetical protein
MRGQQKIVSLDDYEEGAVINALNDMRSKGIAEQQPTDFVDDLILKIIRTPRRKARVRNEAR